MNYRSKLGVKIILCMLFLGAFQIDGLTINQKSFQELKVVLINKIVSYVSWPVKSLNDETIYVGIYGDDEFANLFIALHKNRPLLDRKVVAKKLSGNSNEDVDIIIYSQLPRSELFEKILRVSNKPILTFGDVKGYSQLGIHINFFVAENKVRFEINEEALKRSGLYVQPALIELAEQSAR